MDIPDREELERIYARLIAKLLKAHGGAILEMLGDPPDLNNIPLQFWDDEARVWVAALSPFGQRVYLESAERILGTISVGVDWALVNQAAVDWALSYSYDLVQGINRTTQGVLQRAVSSYFSQGMTIGELEQMVSPSFGPVRAEMIAVTEVTRASVEGERSLVKELEQQGIKMRPIWQTNNDELVCPICSPRHNKEITDGVYPPAHVRCLPGDTLVLPIGGVAAGSERWYEGNVVTIKTFENQLTVTPNHPILTPSGWVAAGLLQEGDYVLGYSTRQWEMLLIKVDNQHGISAIKDIFSSLDFNGFRVPTTAPDFHGDGAGSNVAVIRPNSKIVDDFDSHSFQPTSQGDFIGRDIIVEIPLSLSSPIAQFIKGNRATSGSLMSGLELARALIGSHLTPFNKFGFGLSARGNTGFQNSLPESPTIDPSFVGKLIFGLSGDVSPQKVIKVRDSDFSGHVYNLQTESGLYVAAGIITHNCRCWVNHEVVK